MHHLVSWRRMATAVGLAGVLVLPATPASAHGRLPLGVYPCYENTDGTGLRYSYFDLHLKPDKRYVFKTGDERVGRAGRFTHTSAGRIRFRTGYLASEGFKGEHQRRPGDHTLVLTKAVNGGTAYYYCTD